MIKQLANRFLSVGIVDRLRPSRVVTIRDGVGAGLKFDTSRASGDYGSGLNELPVQQAFATHLKPGDVFYDVGANAGFFTMIGARLVGAKGQTYAFEPVPQNAAVVRHNAEINGFSHVHVIEKAVASESGKGQLLLTRHPGGATLITDHRPPDATEVVSTEMVSLDDLVAKKEIPPPSMAKIDVEGAEMGVLLGMEQILQTARPIVLFEIDDETEEQLLVKATACQELLRQHGYQVTRLTNSYPSLDWKVGHFLAMP